jgi:polyisoprenoid-binding protein YceI
MKSKLALIVLGASIQAIALAAPQSFDFKDPKGVNNVIFKTDAPLESINGMAAGISGSATFDPADPGAIKGKIIVAAASLHVGNPMMKEHLHSDKWMNVAKFPEITFEVESASNVKTTDNTTTADVTGAMTIKGISKKLTVPVKLTYLKDKLSARVPNMKGDLLVLRANFLVKRSDFGINAGTFEEKVSDAIELNLSVAGASPR